MIVTPKIFISYSWTTPIHEDWVINLAERLVSDGVDVKIDKWDLKEGHDKYNFMESMVRSVDIQRVLIILDKKYAEKAEYRTGGVGTETQIISPQIYENVSQEKFIPIVAETDINGKAYVPTFLQSRIYIDLSNLSSFEENYEKLLRNIFQRPAYSKPKLGNAPSYLFDETPMTHRTSNIIRSFDNQILKSPQKINVIIKEFLDLFFEDLKSYSVDVNGIKSEVDFGKIIYDNIISYTPLRNDYIIFLDKLFKSGLEFDIDIFIVFFEKLPSFKLPLDDRMSWNPHSFDNFRFIIHEIFLYSIAQGLRNENYKFISDILYSGYFYFDKYSYNNDSKRFDYLYNYVEIFDQFYRHAFSQNFNSPMADLIIKRVHDSMTRDDIINADLLCHYIAVLEKLEWFPITYIYRERDGIKFELFNRLISKRHFDKVKVLFNVDSLNELQDKLTSIQMKDVNPDRIRYSNSFRNVVPIYKLIDSEKIGTIR